MGVSLSWLGVRGMPEALIVTSRARAWVRCWSFQPVPSKQKLHSLKILFLSPLGISNTFFFKETIMRFLSQVHNFQKRYLRDVSIV